jgi:hypothetical protein
MNKAQEQEIRRLLKRYQIEVVERFGLCPWAKAAREQGEVAVEIVEVPGSLAWGGSPANAEDVAASTVEEVCRVAAAMMNGSNPEIKVGMLIILDANCDRIALRELRNHVSKAVPSVGVADFHPDAAIDLATPARLVSYLRSTPDPLLQMVPFSILDEVRGGVQTVDRAAQLAMLGGISGGGAAPREDIGDLIAEKNHARIKVDDGALLRETLADISQDRVRSYQRVGLLP